MHPALTFPLMEMWPMWLKEEQGFLRLQFKAQAAAVGIEAMHEQQRCVCRSSRIRTFKDATNQSRHNLTKNTRIGVIRKPYPRLDHNELVLALPQSCTSSLSIGNELYRTTTHEAQGFGTHCRKQAQCSLCILRTSVYQLSFCKKLSTVRDHRH